MKKNKYTSRVVDNSSIELELWTEYNEIINCYIDFRTHKSKGKINGIYALRISPVYEKNSFSIKFISRKGNKGKDFSDEIEQKETELFSTIINGKITIELIYAIINRMIPIINDKVNNTNKHNYWTLIEPMFINHVKRSRKLFP